MLMFADLVEIGEQELKDEAFFNKIIHAKIPVYCC
jgi:GTP-binding protein Era